MYSPMIFLRFGLKSHFLPTKSHSQRNSLTDLINYIYIAFEVAMSDSTNIFKFKIITVREYLDYINFYSVILCIFLHLKVS